MDGLQIIAPKPPAHVRAAIDRDREREQARLEAHQRRCDPPPVVETRTHDRGQPCSGCGFGGFHGKCTACGWHPGERVEHRATAPDEPTYGAAERQLQVLARYAGRPIEHSAAVGRVLNVRW